MARKTLQVVIALSLLGASTFVILWVFLPIDLFYIDFMISAMVVLVPVLSVEFVSDTPLKLDKVAIERIAHGLRARGYFVEEKEGRVWVRIDRLSRIVLIPRATEYSSSFHFKIDPPSNGSVSSPASSPCDPSSLDGALDEQEFERLLEACDQGDPKERLIVHQGLES